MLVIGSTNSSNSNRLVEVAREHGAASHLIDNHTQVREEWLEGVETVGITSGASAPEELVEAPGRALPRARRRGGLRAAHRPRGRPLHAAEGDPRGARGAGLMRRVMSGLRDQPSTVRSASIRPVHGRRSLRAASPATWQTSRSRRMRGASKSAAVRASWPRSWLSTPGRGSRSVRRAPRSTAGASAPSSGPQLVVRSSRGAEPVVAGMCEPGRLRRRNCRDADRGRVRDAEQLACLVDRKRSHARASTDERLATQTGGVATRLDERHGPCALHVGTIRTVAGLVDDAAALPGTR